MKMNLTIGKFIFAFILLLRPAFTNFPDKCSVSELPFIIKYKRLDENVVNI